MQRLERSLGPGLRTYNPPEAITPAGVFHSVSTACAHTIRKHAALYTTQKQAEILPHKLKLPPRLCLYEQSLILEASTACHTQASWSAELAMPHCLSSLGTQTEVVGCDRGLTWQAAVRRG